MTRGARLYILKCADGSYYTGTTRVTLELRLAEHKAATTTATPPNACR